MKWDLLQCNELEDAFRGVLIVDENAHTITLACRNQCDMQMSHHVATFSFQETQKALLMQIIDKNVWIVYDAQLRQVNVSGGYPFYHPRCQEMVENLGHGANRYTIQEERNSGFITTVILPEFITDEADILYYVYITMKQLYKDQIAAEVDNINEEAAYQENCRQQIAQSIDSKEFIKAKAYVLQHVRDLIAKIKPLDLVSYYAYADVKKDWNKTIHQREFSIHVEDEIKSLKEKGLKSVVLEAIGDLLKEDDDDDDDDE